jgi:hypothetical protein
VEEELEVAWRTLHLDQAGLLVKNLTYQLYDIQPPGSGTTLETINRRR